MAKSIEYAVILESQAMMCLRVPLDDRGVDVEKQIFGFSSLEEAREFLDMVIRAAADEAGVLIDSSEAEVRVGYSAYESGKVFVKRIDLFW